MKKKATLPEFRLDCNAMTSRMMEYDGLRDSNLASYFAGRTRRKHLQKVGLVTKQGVVLSGPKHTATVLNPSVKKPKGVKPLSKNQFQELLARSRLNNENE